MATRLRYLEDFAVLSCTARVGSVTLAQDGRTMVTLDETCFYPRGGGQDWDTGTIYSDTAAFEVEEVRLDEAGIVWHNGLFKQGDFRAGEMVHCKVNESRRMVNTRLHSAGHLIDMAVQRLGLGWVPGRGAHYPHMSFVEYRSDEAVNETLKHRLQAVLDELATSTYENQIRFMPVSEMGAYCRYIPNNIPTNKPSRIVLYSDDFGIPCGGTHVKRAQEIGHIDITKIKAKKGLIKVSYAIMGIN